MIDCDTSEFTELLERVRAGDQQAAAAIQERFEPAIREAVRRCLIPPMRTKFDSLDFVQEVWLSFFANLPPDGKLTAPEDIVRLLSLMAHNKVTDAIRQRLDAKKHSIRREQSLDDPAAGWANVLAADQSTPSHAAREQDEWTQFLDGLPVVYRQVVVALRAGKSLKDIAAELKVHPRSIYRWLDQLKAGITS